MTNAEFVEAARRIYEQGAGYIWGESGAIWTQAKQNRATRAQTVKYGSKWIGWPVYDCAGLVRAILKTAGISFPSGTNSQWSGNYFSAKGVYSASIIPQLLPGDLLYKYNGTDGYYHVGIYEGDGYVIEAQGTQAGVVRTALKGWTHWARLKSLTYTTQTEARPLASGDKAIVTAQSGKSVRVRSSTSTKNNDNVITVLPLGTEVDVVAESGGWTKVRYYTEGYMMSQYLKGADGK